MFQVILRAFTVLKAGERLANVEAWKNLQAATNDSYIVICGVVALFRVYFPEFMPSDAILLSAAAGCATVLSAVNAYLTRATTDKIGL